MFSPLARFHTVWKFARRWWRPRPSQERGLVVKTPADSQHAVAELAALLNAEVRVTEIILQALEARIVGLKVVRLRQLLLCGRWVRGCARISIGHKAYPLWSGLRDAPTSPGPSLCLWVLHL